MNSNPDVFDSNVPDIYRIATQASGPPGSLPITEEMLLHSPSGDLFGMTQNAGMAGIHPRSAANNFSFSAPKADSEHRTESPSRLDTTRAIGKSACSCKRRRKNFAN